VCDRVVCVLDLVCLKLNLNFVLVLPKFATALAYNSFSIVCVCIRFTFKSILIISILGFFFPFSYDSLFFLCFFPLLLDFSQLNLRLPGMHTKNFTKFNLQNIKGFRLQKLNYSLQVFPNLLAWTEEGVC